MRHFVLVWFAYGTCGWQIRCSRRRLPRRLLAEEEDLFPCGLDETDIDAPVWQVLARDEVNPSKAVAALLASLVPAGSFSLATARAHFPNHEHCLARRARLLSSGNPSIAILHSATLEKTQNRYGHHGAQMKERRRIQICSGAACTRNGGPALANAIRALSGLHTELGAMSCTHACPARRVMIQGDGMCSKQVVPTLESARDLLDSLGIESVPDEVADAYQLKLEADADLLMDPEQAAMKYTAALEAAEEHLGASMWDPTHEPLDEEGEWVAWENSAWLDSKWGLYLTFGESAANFEFATSDGGELKLTDCIVGDTDEDWSVPLSGSWEHSNGESGTFEVLLDRGGRRFSGTLVDENDSSEEWSGTKFDPSAPALVEDPPDHIRWVYEAVVRRGQAYLESSPAMALDDADTAVALACRASEGWELKAEASKALGDTLSAEAAMEMLLCLCGSNAVSAK